MPYFLICAVLILWATFFPCHWAGLPSDEDYWDDWSYTDYAFLCITAAIGPVMLFLWVINL